MENKHSGNNTVIEAMREMLADNTDAAIDYIANDIMNRMDNKRSDERNKTVLRETLLDLVVAANPVLSFKLKPAGK